MNSVDDARALFRNEPERYDRANMALAMMDAAALYAERKYVDTELFMNEWGYICKNMLEHARYLMAERVERNALPRPRPIEHFFNFAMKAASHEWPERDTAILDESLGSGVIRRRLDI